MKKWLVRSFVVIVGFFFVSFAVGSVSYFMWKSREIAKLEQNSTVIETSRGQVEYAIAGEGTPFLQFHGNPGGYDQSVAGAKRFPEHYVNRQMIGVSRPGYLRTPLSSGATFEEQADLFAALLDELGIEKVFAFGVSGGGYPALQFAMRHPERCHGLILLNASVNYEPLIDGDYTAAMRDVPVPNVLAWILSGPMFKFVAENFIPDLDPNNPDQIAAIKDVLQSLFLNFEARLPGIRNDILQRDFPEIDHWSLESISVPTLILHGDMDTNSVYAGALHVASQVPNSKLVTFEGGDHNMIITRGDEIRSEISQFVGSVLQDKLVEW